MVPKKVRTEGNSRPSQVESDSRRQRKTGRAKNFAGFFLKIWRAAGAKIAGKFGARGFFFSEISERKRCQ